MEHQIQGLVLVNNEWVSRPHDVYQIMARAQQTDTEMREPTIKPTIRVPDYGILSRTLFASPMCSFILPANIRHKDLTDIVLVGEDSVQLKEIRDYGHLRHVATKTDFSGRILAARVFGDPREVPRTKSIGSPLPKKQTMHRHRRSMTGDEEYNLPPEVIILTLASRTMVFLWARELPTGAVAFCQKTIKLPTASSRFDRPGPFLAVDPRRRAIAVAAHEGLFILYKTKPMNEWREEARGGKETTPIEDERIFPIEGRVMHMDFLSSGGGKDDFHVVLLFIVAHHGKTKITCFDWDSRQDLSSATARTERVSADFEDHNPSLLIPLSRSPDFLLVFDTHLSVYKDVLSGIPVRSKVPIKPPISPPLRPGDSKHRPKWVAWDKTPRNPEFSKEAFYIAREDGRVMYAERASTGSVDLDDAGEWPYRIDTAFACVSVDNSEFSQLYPDVLIAGGAGNDGLLCKVGAWPTEYSYSLQYPGTNQFTHVESLPNWTPLTDLAVTRLSGLRAPYERKRSAIFVANGSTPQGEISELRCGLHAFVDDSFSGMDGCTGLWVVDYGSQTVEIEGNKVRQHYATFAITLPLETLLVRIIRTQPESRGEFSGAWEDGIWDKAQIPTEDEIVQDNIMRDEETISACTWSNDLSIQVTRSEARFLRRPNLQQTDSISFNPALLLAASRTAFPFIAITFRESGHTYLEIIPASRDGTFGKTKNLRHQLAHDPTCLQLLEINGAPHVFVSTFDSKIMLLSLNDSGVPSVVLEASIGSVQISETSMLCESVALLSLRERLVLVCTTRNGFLLSADLPIAHFDNLQLEWKCFKLGETSAQIARSQTDPAAAFVSCGSDFCRVRCSQNNSSGVEIDSIWFTNHANPAYSQASVTAMSQLPFLQELDALGRNLGGFLFAVAGDQLLFAQLDSDIRWMSQDTDLPPRNDCKVVPRKLLTTAKPTNVVYIKSLRKMIVSTIEAKEERAPPDGYRVLHSTIKLLNIQDDKPLDEPDTKPEEGGMPLNRLVVAQCHLKHAERVYSIVEWPFVDHHGKKYSLIIVGTGIKVGPGKETGRRLIFNTGKTGTRLQLQKESVYDHPVYCISLWGNDSTVSVIGKTLSLDYFDSQAGRWFKRGTKELPSPGLHISTQSPFVYVSTLQHSHICYEVVGTAREDRFDFEQVFTDSRERSCTHHLVLDLPSTVGEDNSNDRIVIFTDKKSSSLTGLHHPPERTYKNASDTVFEACLPRTIVRLQRGDIRPPWRRTAHSNNITGVLADDIIGACSDGALYTLSILSQSARRLLCLIQNIIKTKRARNFRFQNIKLKSRSGDISDILMNGADGNQDERITARTVDPRYQEHGTGGPQKKHIDGDMLVRWLNEDGKLRPLLCEGTEQDVEVLFVELALGVNKEWSTSEETKLVDSGDLAVTVTEWLEKVLMPVL
ncbi:mono-functional DNA-alkylating methyl methanesulfonate N-term-domain-containing protein [Pyrenochaeta sp. MPI-SDFR-AT-0127]|nr:mono-functional DNA-alkylating methyl methanesulfonate N-term-domain-containing protein [Pyrenochaeta sp. MPI-SDFR-AT-0127]